MDDPLAIDWFAPPRKHVDAPEPHRAPAKSIVPEVDRLFSIQKHLIKAIDFFPETKEHSRETEAARTSLEDAYRGLNKYLETYSATAGGGTLE